MKSSVLRLAQAGLLTLDPERAHDLTLRALERGLYPKPELPQDRRLAQDLFGCHFANPVGMAAGFDKDARVLRPLFELGFGFVEVGTVTPEPQPGNPRPRIFRLIRQRGVINRLGFNSQGHEAVRARLARQRFQGVVGVNIGANKESDNFIADYEAGLRAFADCADYFTVNVSSPNTPGLRALQTPDRLNTLLERLTAVRVDLAGTTPAPPLLVKLSPDIPEDELPEVVQAVLAHDVAGLILTNTTLSRPDLESVPQASETGGLSGRPLFPLATRVLAQVYVLSEGRLPLIGVGGVDSAETAVAKVQAGASLVQLYSGLIYEGVGLVAEILNGLAAALDRAGAATLADLRGTRAREWAAEPPA
ncbi:quinone-dependent dihydroorotate dehydrogenase [Dichotomicrobium thermohalophilum]|uniref:Dihydroorotate dehydrogenase (quinone) n=1 Tax=Dichotomicrobium thermohalophilum TaxID=933063 RepID=A0A397Q6Y3_9HYPH|nr:quinone-dependent dihydroorotate dehydrogenase [Dichotomicrobium thermohalophilum]RIA56842.1 dihydroorotate oxidase A [Dichotomicrobium thermohalophilum]